MPGRVVVFSAEPLRGRIIQEVLLRGGFESLLLQTIQQVKETFSLQSQDVAVLDTAGCFREEIKHLNNLCVAAAETAVILLGDGLVLERFEESATPAELRLIDPLDPNLIVEKVKELLSSKRKEIYSDDVALEEDLKGFLRLS